jgi:hypothetical protein
VAARGGVTNDVQSCAPQTCERGHPWRLPQQVPIFNAFLTSPSLPLYCQQTGAFHRQIGRSDGPSQATCRHACRLCSGRSKASDSSVWAIRADPVGPRGSLGIDCDDLEGIDRLVRRPDDGTRRLVDGIGHLPARTWQKQNPVSAVVVLELVAHGENRHFALDLLAVPYKGGAPLTTDLLGGQIVWRLVTPTRSSPAACSTRRTSRG